MADAKPIIARRIAIRASVNVKRDMSVRGTQDGVRRVAVG
jgi:hypothetical protein